jgi:hypothetical protein
MFVSSHFQCPHNSRITVTEERSGHVIFSRWSRGARGWLQSGIIWEAYLRLLRSKRHRLFGSLGPNPPVHIKKHVRIPLPDLHAMSFSDQFCLRPDRGQALCPTREQGDHPEDGRVGSYQPWRGSCSPWCGSVDIFRIFWATRSARPLPAGPAQPSRSVSGVRDVRRRVLKG